MSDRTTPAAAVPQASTAANPQPAPAAEVVSPTLDAAAVLPARLFADGREGLPPLRRLAASQQHRTLLALQSTVGNAAVQRLLIPDPRLVARPAGASPVPVARIADRPSRLIQRKLDDEQKKLWDDKNGDQIVADLKSALTTWEVWRKTPATFDSMPKPNPSGLSQLSELVRLGGPAFGQHAAEQLGGRATTYLSEMAAFIPAFNLLIGVVPGVAYVNPEHKYVLKADSSGSVLEKFLPFGNLKVTYSNAFGWYWSKSLTGTVIGLGVGFGYEKGKGPKAGLSKPWPGQISVNVEATAKSTAYWGLDNLEGAVLIVNGPSLKGTALGFGGKLPSGGIISFVGTGGPPTGPLAFMNLAGGVDVKTQVPKKPSDAKNPPEISVSIVEGGGGAVWAGPGQDEIATPELAPEAVPAERIWTKAIAGFEVGSDQIPIPPNEMHPVLGELKAEIDDKKRSIDSLREAFAELGMEEEFKVSFHVEGYASRPWAAARDDNDRRQRNQELSERRAQNVSSALYELFGPLHEYGFAGKGAAIIIQESGPDGGGQHSEIVPEAGNEERIEELIRQKEREYREQFPDATEEEIRAWARRQFGKTPQSEAPAVRRVHITAIWRGHDIKWAQNTSPAPTPRDGQRPPAGSGGGGAGGGLPSGTDGGGGTQGGRSSGADGGGGAPPT